MYTIKLLRNGKVNVFITGFGTFMDALNFSKKFGYDPDLKLKIEFLKEMVS